jgi:hypothetical protein
MGVLFTIILIVIIILVVLGIGVGATFDAIKSGWEKVPADNIVENFKNATEKSITDITQEIKP